MSFDSDKKMQSLCQFQEIKVNAFISVGYEIKGESQAFSLLPYPPNRALFLGGYLPIC